MSQTIKLKRSAITGRIPNLSNLELGEIAINTYDGKLYIKKDVAGVEEVVEVGKMPLNPSFDSVFLAGAAGPIVWNTVEEALDIPLNSDVTLQVGQEQVFRGKATETILNGDVVMFVGAQGDHLLIAKADMSATGFRPEHVIGLATQDFLVNDFGFVTSFGKVRGLNTTAFNEGDILYLDAATPGALTTAVPAPPNHSIQLCAVVRSHVAEGTYLVRPRHFPDTDEIIEGLSNLYFTNARAVAAIKADSSWNASNWDTAYSWGNHADAGYLTSASDSQTLFWNGANGQLSITGGNTVDLDGRYLQSFSETDTLDSVTTRGNTTTNDISVANLTTQDTVTFNSTDGTKSISASMLDSGTLSFSGTSGQLFSISDSMSGTIFSVNDISGIPSVEVDDDGTIRLAEFSGNTLIGTSVDNGTDKLQVNGTISATTPSTSTNDTTVATTAYVKSNISDLIGGAPAALDTLNELAAAINDDSIFSSTVTTALGNRLRVDTASQGLTEAQKTNALTNLGISAADIGKGVTAHGWGNHASAGYSTTDTTYSVGDGGLTEKNFTTALKTKLDGIATTANNYVLPFTNNSNNWNTAYGWGDHSAAGYLTSETNDYVDSATFSSGTLTLGRTGSLSDVTVSLDGRYSQTDTNTTYSVSAADVASGKAIRLTGSNAVTDDVILAGGNNVSLTRSGDTITINAANAPADIVTTLTKVGNDLRYVNEAGTTSTIDLTSYLDDTNLSKIIEGTMSSSGIATFSRDDSSTFTVDMSVLLDDTNLSRITSAAWNTGNGVLTLTRNDGSTIPVDLDNRYLQSYIETDTLQSVTTRGNTTNNDIIISKNSPKLRLYDTNGNPGSFPTLEFETDNSQGISLYLNEFDGELPLAGYGLVVGPASSNTQFPTSGDLSLNVLGEIYTGGETLTSLHKVWHAGNFNPSSYLLASNYVDNYADSAAFNTSTGVLTIGRTGSLADLTVDLDGRYLQSYTIPEPSNGNWWNDGFVSVRTDGVMEVGKYIDFHNTSADTTDFTARITNNGAHLYTTGRWYVNNNQQVFADDYHPNADKWTTARSHTVALTGDVTGSATQSVDGTGNRTWTISTAVGNDSHSHSSITGTAYGANPDTYANSTVSGRLEYHAVSASSSGALPTADNANGVLTVGQHSGGYTAQLGFSSNGNFYFRDNPSSSIGSWRKVWDSGNFNPSDYLQVSNYVDTDNYVDSVSFSTSTGVLTLGRTGSLSDLTIDLDGRYLTSETDNQTLSWNGTNGVLSISGGNSVDLDGRYLQSYAETDTLQSVCSRGNTTNTDVIVNGLLTATQKSFTIDHPTKEGHKLRYGSLEGPENGVYVRGRLKNNNTIELPEYWKELVHENSITVNLTAIGKGQDIWVEDFNTEQVIVGGESVNCFYTIYGERKDVDKLVTEFKEVE